MVWSSIGGAALGAAGGIAQNLMGQSAAREQMEFQERAMKKRYQWTMRDMKAAGLNPIQIGRAHV